MARSGLRVHVIGTGYGESVIIEFPDSTVGVIDSIGSRIKPSWTKAATPDDHPLIRFLQRFLRAKRIRFLLLSHPHADHCLGFSQLLDYYKNRTDLVIIPSAFRSETDPRPLSEVLFQQKKNNIPDPTEKAAGVEVGRLAMELSQLGAHLEKFRPPFTPIPEYWNGSTQPLELSEMDIRIIPVSPSGWSITELNRQTDLAIKQLAARRAKTVKPGKYRAPNFNLASVALLLEYGQTRILLCADAFDQVWTEMFAQWGVAGKTAPLERCKVISMLKVGHHGSREWCGVKFQKFLRSQAKFLSVVTPFTHQASPLPTRSAMLDLRKRSTLVVTTHREAAIKSSKLPWVESSKSFRAVPLPPKAWLDTIRQHPNLGALLAGVSVKAQLPLLPASWLADIRRNPSLAGCLNPQMLINWGPEHLHRVTFCFGRKGAQLQSQAFFGPATGVLGKTT